MSLAKTIGPKSTSKPDAEPTGEVWTTEEACRWFKCEKHTLYKKIKRGELRAGRSGKDYRFRRHDLEALFVVRPVLQRVK